MYFILFLLTIIKVWVFLVAIIPITALGLTAVDHGENRGIGDFKALFKPYGILIMKSLLSQSIYAPLVNYRKLKYIYIFLILHFYHRRVLYAKF